jgi:hypothetical protein
MKTITRSLPRLSLASLCGLLFVAPSFVDGANMVLNGGFEDGAATILPVNGTAVGGGSTSLVKATLGNWDVGPVGSPNGENAIATNESLYFATIANGDPAGGGPHSGQVAAVFPNFPVYDGYISQAIAGVVAGQVYTISFWLSNQIGTNPNNLFTVNWGGTFTNTAAPITGGTTVFSGAIPVQTPWTFYSFDVVAPTNNARLSFIGGNTAAATLLDDVSVQVAGVPDTGSSFALLGIALAGLVLFHRKGQRPALA